MALVADLGGGTSDFSVIRLCNQYIRKAERTSDVLANTGIRVGGNDFDKDLSLAAVMPEMGYKTTYGEKNLEVPTMPFHDLAEWSKVNSLYNVKLRSQILQILHQAHQKEKYRRLLNVLEEETGHALLAAVEEAKIALTTAATYRAAFSFIEPGLSITTTRKQFNEAIHENISRITTSALECLNQAQIKSSKITLIILTGGTTEVPAVQAAFKNLFPTAAIADENKLSSVGLGLGYDSRYKFGY